MIITTAILFLLYFYLAGRIHNLLLKDIMRFVVFLYSAQLALAAWDPYEVYPLSVFVFLLFHCQIVVMLAAVLQYDKTHYKGLYAESNVFQWPKVNINGFAVVLISILLLYTLWNYRRMNNFLMTQAVMTMEVREYYFSTFFASYTLLLVDTFLVTFKYIALILSFIILLSKKKTNWKEKYFVVSSLAVCVLQSLIAQSRIEILVIVIIAIFFVFVARRYDRVVFKKRILPFFSILMAGFVAVFFTTTLLRANITGDQFDVELIDDLIIEPFATYFYIPVLAFDFGRQNVLNFDFPFFGAATFSSVYDTILLPFVAIDKSLNAFSMDHILGNSIGVGEYFPSGKHWMAMYTGCADYYLDFWYLGFLIFPLLHGRILSVLSYRSLHKSTLFVIAAFFFYCTFRHAVSLAIQGMGTAFFLFWLWMVRKNKVI